MLTLIYIYFSNIMAFTTLNEVAKEAGCSANTVSRYINKKGYISMDAAEKIQKAIEKLNYYPSINARAMKKYSSNIISVIIPSIKNDFYVEIIREAENKLKEYGYNVMIFETRSDADKEKYILELSISHRVDGIIMSSISNLSDKLLNTITNINRIPLVLMEILHEGVDCDYIYMQNEYGAMILTEHLIKIHDKKRIGLILPLLENNVSIQRFEGYKKALEKNGIKYDDNLVVFCEINKANGFKHTVELLKDKNPDAIFTSNTIFGTGAIKAFDEMKVKYPKDISFVTFDEYDINTLFHPYITSLHRVDKKFGILAADLVIEQILKKRNNPKKIEIDLSLNIGESCGCK